MRAARFLATFSALTLPIACANVLPAHDLPATPLTASQIPLPSRPPSLQEPTLTSPPSTPGPIKAPPDCRAGASLDLGRLNPALRDPLEATKAYLEAGGEETAVNTYLEGIGVLPKLETPEGTEFGSVTAYMDDLTGDGTEESLVTISAPLSSLTSTAAWFVAFACPDGTTAIHGGLIDECLDDCRFDLSVADIAGVGYPQLMVLEQAAPEGWTCPYTNVLVTSPREDGWRLFLDARPVEFDSACTVTFEPSSDQHSRDIVLEGYRSGGGGTLPSRIVLEAYSFDGQQLAFTLSRREYLPSGYRIHVIEDAQHAIDQGQIGKALALYRIAMFDALIDYPSNGESGIRPGVYAYEEDPPPPPFAYQTAFAAFRSVLLLESAGDRQAALRYLRLMPSAAQQGGEFTEMATLSLALIDEGLDLSEACAAASAQVAQDHPRLLGYDGHIGYWGPATISYDLTTVCPTLGGT